MINKKNRNKLGRNDPCFCGSGKKYKKCCLGKNIPSYSKLSELEQLKLEFSDYKQLDLIATLGGLQVYPENHSHTIRLETASRVACSIKNNGKRKIDPNQLQSLLNNLLPSDGNIGA